MAFLDLRNMNPIFTSWFGLLGPRFAVTLTAGSTAGPQKTLPPHGPKKDGGTLARRPRTVVNNEHRNRSVSAAARRRVTVVIVSYNSSQHLPRLFAALPAASESRTKIQVVVADNASTDDSAELVRLLWPSAELVQMAQNLGYAAGINAAVEAAGPSDAILALNADIQMAPSCVDQLLDGLDGVDVGITVPRLVDSTGDLAHSLRREPRVASTLFEAVFGGNRSGWVSRFGETIAEPQAYERSTQADWATGAAMMISRQCWEATGPWMSRSSFSLRRRTMRSGLVTPGSDCPLFPKPRQFIWEGRHMRTLGCGRCSSLTN